MGDVNIYLVPEICFCEAGCAEMKPQWLQQFSAKAGIRFRKLSYWFT
jgi:hypothetical protein